MNIEEFDSAIPRLLSSLSLQHNDPRFLSEVAFFRDQLTRHQDLRFWGLHSVICTFKFGFLNHLSWDSKQQLISILGSEDGSVTHYIHYRGKIKLACIQGIIERVDCELIFENDEFKYNGPDRKPEHSFTLKKDGRGSVMGGYSVSYLQGGGILSFFFDLESLHNAEALGIEYGNEEIWIGPHKNEMYRKSILSASSKRWQELKLQLTDKNHPKPNLRSVA